MDRKNRRSALRQGWDATMDYLLGFLRWIAVGLALGVLGGLVGTAFCKAIAAVTAFRAAHSAIVWLLPLGGVLIVWLYSLGGTRPTDTNGVLLALHSNSRITPSTGPLIFVSTMITHALGGSAGREGAALQLGGVLGSSLGKLLRLNEEDTRLIIMCGMSAVFAALFGAPLTAALFAIEVASVGIFHFSAILPCLTSALTAVHLAGMMGVHADRFPLETAFAFSLHNIFSVAGISVACAVVSIFYCVALRQGGTWWGKKLPNPYLRAAAGVLCVAVLTAVLGTAYNGAGMDVIERAMEGDALPWAFALKFLFTVVTMTSGYKGGEIVPAMFIGATLGAVLGNLFSLAPGLGAAVGLLSMFCASLNCPVSSVFLGLEMFGGSNIRFFAIAAAISFMLSANYGLYKEQKIVNSKIRPEVIDRYTD